MCCVVGESTLFLVFGVKRRNNFAKIKPIRTMGILVLLDTCVHLIPAPLLDVLRPGIVGMRGPMVLRVRPCMIMSTPPSMRAP